MEKDLLRLLLKYDFYKDNLTSIDRRIFPNELTELFDLIVESHEKFKKDLTIGELKALYAVNHPTATVAKKENIAIILNSLPTEISEDVAKEIIRKAYITEAARELSEIGLDIINGKAACYEKAREIIDKIEKGKLAEADDLGQVTDDLEEIINAVTTTTRWKYNITALEEAASGVGPGIFGGIMARVETGKTALAVSLCAAPKGFAEQGAVVHFYCNEEVAIRTKARAVSCFTGIPAIELPLKIKKAKTSYDKVKDNLKFFECRDKTVLDIEAHIKKQKPDIVIVDQLDKLQIAGSYAREDERLGALYIRFRDILATYQCAGIGMSQANAEAEGKAILHTANMSNARTSKPAELDILIGIGRSELHDDNARYLNLIKNKVTGSHKDIVCYIVPELSRYVS